MQHAHSMSGPHALWEYAIVVCAVVILVWVLYLAFKYTLWPGEKEPNHVKYKILEDAEPPRGTDESLGAIGQVKPGKDG